MRLESGLRLGGTTAHNVSCVFLHREIHAVRVAGAFGFKSGLRCRRPLGAGRGVGLIIAPGPVYALGVVPVGVELVLVPVAGVGVGDGCSSPLWPPPMSTMMRARLQAS